MKQLLKFLLISILIFTYFPASAKKLNVLIVTGGHDFDRKSFFEMFDSFQEISYTELKHPEANLQLGTISLKTFDAVVFYDMPKTISEAEKESYHKLLNTGNGLVFLHHSLASYQQWDEFKTIIGGKYHEEQNIPASSTYQHEVNFRVKITDPKHPVTKGVTDFEIFDEVYGNTEVLPEVMPLLFTDHPQSSKIIGWTHQKENSRIVYLQPGHDKNAWFNPNYQKLVRQAIAFVAAK
ncbi:MAG: ThuA domain-containing protein [Bacteroidota bacterium]|nr:ThuA domain-containing protein [Odoribacter sp.]MDP3642629.1 ThuA domain-containing protein [Bacteroidota bacterium]